MREVVRRHRLAFFFITAFLLSWYPWLIALARGKTTGPNPLGPLAAALLVTAIAYGKAGLEDFLRRLVRWRVAPSAWLVAIGLPILLCGLAALAASMLAHEPVRVAPVRWQDLLETFVFILLFIGLGEEPGWRGYALPELLERHSPIGATTILASVWALWHLPLMGTEFPLPIVPAFLVSLFGVSFVQTWLLRRAEGSVLPQMVMHATVNTVGARTVFRWFAPGDHGTLWTISAALWLVAGVVALAPRWMRVAGGQGARPATLLTRSPPS